MEFAIKNRENGMYESFEFSGKEVVQTIGADVVSLMATLETNEFSKYSTIKKGNIVTKIDLPSNVKIKLSSRMPFSYTVPGEYHVYYNKKKITDFLYEIDFGNIDYSYAKEYFKSKVPVSEVGSCSSVRNGKFYGRSLDWLYDNHVDFVVHTPKSESRNAVLGVSGIVPGLFKGDVDNDNVIFDGWEMFKVLPFYLLDGVNDKGVFANSNVVPLDNEAEPTTEVPATVEERDRLCALMVPRFILDNFSSAEAAIDYIKKYVTVYFPQGFLDIKYQLHFQVGDFDSSYVIDFIDGKMLFTKSNYMTNFQVNGTIFNKDGKVYTPADVEIDEENKPTVKNNVHPHGAGLERWNLIVDAYRSASTKDNMRRLMDSLFYSRAYKGTPDVPEKFWNSETVGAHTDAWYTAPESEKDDPKYVISVDTKPSECTKCIDTMAEMYQNRKREDANVWITTHSCVYDLSLKKLFVKVQEEPKEFTFFT